MDRDIERERERESAHSTAVLKFDATENHPNSTIKAKSCTRTVVQ